MQGDNATTREIPADTYSGNDLRLGVNAKSVAPEKSAAPELIGFAVIGLAIMGLLTAGYATRSRVETAQVTTPAGQTTGMSQGMAQPAGSSDQPKNYQPVNPAPDTRAAPTSSDTGVGPANGSTGQVK